MAVLECEALTIGYAGKPVLEHLSFSVRAGDYLCIVGENGSGKSTLMKTLLGLIPPISGTIRRGCGLRPNEIGYLPQQTELQKDFPASVWEVVLSGCQNRGGFRPFYGKAEKAQARENLERLGIGALQNKRYCELSGGQRQRVLLARALCATRTLLLLDEPVTGLDPQAAAEMYALVKKLNQKECVTVMMISHDMDAALRDGNRILRLGASPFFGSRDSFLREGGPQV